ncbi:hypothetical protein WDZ16_07140 [Pseudokineococcus marinus]|uniref:Uncharacterized protein n=1 Tax=Pseudokineococcus marinus TaxID=351215 RepID=A0A849BN25_9ACTN|nr:hypothetical protein [Pseudokineococcus marinus]NNH24600.1 hypothetical protein [Pseudokineococcus marinus]
MTDLVRGLLPAAGTALFPSGGPAVGAVHGGLVLAAWVVAVLGAAAWRLRTGDVR